MKNDFKILHVDGDSFFAACEMARFPHLRDLPVVVGEERGIACAMSYQAKKLGIHRAMPIFKIKREFPQVIILSSHFELYEMYSVRLYKILKSFSDNVEKYSIDECFAILKEANMKSYGSWEKYIATIKEEVQNSLGITFSFGLASTKVLAKVASKQKKPDGCTVLYDKEIVSVLDKFPISSIWGIGYHLSKQLVSKNILTAGKFISMPIEWTSKYFAKPVQEIWYELQGKQILAVENNTALPKSLQATRSFQKSNDFDFVWSEFSRNVEIACARLRNYDLVAKRAHFYLKYNKWSYVSDHAQFEYATHNPTDILQSLEKKFKALWQAGIEFRATGITVFDLNREGCVQYDLFYEQEKIFTKDSLLFAIDQIRDKYGLGSITLGTSFKSVRRREKDDEYYLAKDPYVWGLPLPFLGEAT